MAHPLSKDHAFLILPKQVHSSTPTNEIHKVAEKAESVQQNLIAAF